MSVTVFASIIWSTISVSSCMKPLTAVHSTHLFVCQSHDAADVSSAAAETASAKLLLLLLSTRAAAWGAGAGAAAVLLTAAGAADDDATLSPLMSVAADDELVLPGPVVVTAMPGPAADSKHDVHTAAWSCGQPMHMSSIQRPVCCAMTRSQLTWRQRQIKE